MKLKPQFFEYQSKAKAAASKATNRGSLIRIVKPQTRMAALWPKQLGNLYLSRKHPTEGMELLGEDGRWRRRKKFVGL